MSWINSARLRRRSSKSRQNTPRDHKPRRLNLEPLEERQLLTVLYWDPNHSGGTNLGGTGSWLGSNNWWDGTNDVSWTDGNDARFNISGSGSAGTVTIGSAASAASVQFLAAGYTLSSSTLTLTGTGSTIIAGQSATINSSIVIGAGQDWAIASGKVLTVAGVVSGSGALALSDSGALLLSAANTYSGGTAIVNGTLQLGRSNAMPADTVVTFGASSTNGTLELNGFNQQVGGLVVAAGATAANQVIGNSSSSSDSVLTYNDGGGTSSSFGGTIKDKVTGSNTRK